MSINVTKAYLPPLDEYVDYLKGIWERNWLTNNGPLVQKLESELSKTFDNIQVQFTSNGTIALQIAIRALELSGEIITTPFSYVATTTAILWEHCKPVFVDVEPNSFCIDASKIEAAITSETKAILATHVYGYPCDVNAIKEIADKYSLKVIYDGAHAFGVKVYGNSLFSYGDLTTCSFHATKLFHTVEGGAIAMGDASLSNKIWLLKSFGHVGDDYFSLGVNGKNSEFHAAMGLCNLPKVHDFILKRKNIADIYHEQLDKLHLQYPKSTIPSLEYNYAYFPVIFESESKLLKIKDILSAHAIYTRRYFYPSLNELHYVNGNSCPVSEDISRRILCLPFYQELNEDIVYWISKLIIQNF